jgi:hypothetical protein
LIQIQFERKIIENLFVGGFSLTKKFQFVNGITLEFKIAAILFYFCHFLDILF